MLINSKKKNHLQKVKINLDFLSSQRYAMVRATYNTIYKMKKGITDSNLHYTYGFKNIIKGRYKNKLSNYIAEEHLKNVESFMKRQQSIGTVFFIRKLIERRILMILMLIQPFFFEIKMI